VKIGLIGSINRDTVQLADGTLKKGWGGMLYNLVTLSHLLGDKAAFFPVCNIGRDCWKDITAILKRLPGVHLEYLHKVREKNNHCHLRYLPDGEKTEILEGGVPSLRFKDVEPLLDSEVILVNYISGRDVFLKSLQKLRREYHGSIYMDIHSSTLGKKKFGARFFRRPPHWEKMIEVADYIQMNRRELSILVGRKEWPPPEEDNYGNDFKRLTRLLKSSGVDISSKIFLITAGVEGCMVARKQNGIIFVRYFPPVIEVKRGDSTGCGDCFSAGFVAGLAQEESFTPSIGRANAAGQQRISGSRIYKLLSAPSPRKTKRKSPDH
jgi:sugar/nucleoside kinase (ribokinase family)